MTKELTDAQIQLMQETSLNLSAVEMTLRLLEASDIKVSTFEEFMELKNKVREGLFKDVDAELTKSHTDRAALKVMRFDS